MGYDPAVATTVFLTSLHMGFSGPASAAAAGAAAAADAKGVSSRTRTRIGQRQLDALDTSVAEMTHHELAQCPWPSMSSYLSPHCQACTPVLSLDAFKASSLPAWRRSDAQRAASVQVCPLGRRHSWPLPKRLQSAGKMVRRLSHSSAPS